jgi:type I restriction enzyme M protein
MELGLNFDQCKFPKEEEEVLRPEELLKQYHEKRTALDAKIDKQLEEIENLLGIKID